MVGVFETKEKRAAAEQEARAVEICGRGLGKWWRWGKDVLLRASWGCCGCGERVERTNLR